MEAVDSFVQRVKILLVNNKDKSTAAAFSICIEHYNEAKNTDLVSQVLDKFYPCMISFW